MMLRVNVESANKIRLEPNLSRSATNLTLEIWRYLKPGRLKWVVAARHLQQSARLADGVLVVMLVDFSRT